MVEPLFEHGAVWMRADFHLHTKADRKFTYSGDEHFYNSAYVDALIAANIHIAVITNHNKFDIAEFKALRSTAKNKNIFLLPGVELSVNDGANGVHTLIVFSEEWIADGQDYVNQFLNVTFEGKPPSQYENENGRSSLNLLETIKKLEGYHKDFFLVFAHVEQSCGLWDALEGGRLTELGQNEEFRRRTLGFQKVRTHDKPEKKCRVKVKDWLGKWYPAELEGSDPEKIDEIGKGNSCFLKLGAFTFEAVKFALIDYENRLRLKTAPKYTHSHLQQIRFEGGTLNEQTIYFSPELNTFIGIRGSGKSSILEALRYVLNIRLEESDSDREYKQKLVEYTLGSGGKVVLDALDRHGQPYQIRRIWRENVNVFFNDKLQPGVTIYETILHKPLFFGQKELASAGKGSEKDLIEKLLSGKCDAIRRQIADQRTRVADIIDHLSKVSNVAEQIAEQTKIKQDVEFQLNFYKKHNLEAKLQKRLNFDADIHKTKEGITLIEAFYADIRELLARHEDDLRNFIGYASTINADFFRDFDAQFSLTVKSIEIIKAELEKIKITCSELNKKSEQLSATRQSLADEFATIERALAEELKTANDQNISSDEFLALKKKLNTADVTLKVLYKSSDQKTIFQNALNEELQKLNELWLEEFKIIKNELEFVSRENSALQFSVGFKEDKNAFRDYFKSIFKGSGIRDATFQNIVEVYQDFSGIYSDLESARKLFGSNPENFIRLLEENWKNLLTYQVPNKFTITYRGVELAHHSLGQRASALILFVLGQRENDVIIIDQPEDDLDNQTIYEDVIKLIRELKPGVQFIFATHNPNIPVLGDAEQIYACSCKDGKINVQSGGLDDPAQQKNIVGIMEGGKEAFERRKEIYQIWKS
jgi:predicted ATPase